MRIKTCFYCTAPVYPGHGIMFIRNDSNEFIFCGSKCKTHFKARHNPRKSKWTKISRQLRGKEIINDTILNFEKRRNEPIRYNRNLYIKTIQAMKVIEKIKKARQRRFYLSRMKNAEKYHMRSFNKVLANSGNLLNLIKLDTKRRDEISEKTKNLIQEASKEKKATLINIADTMAE